MRVIHVITRLIVGGAQENTAASVLGLRAKPGWDVTLVAGPTFGPEGSLEPLFADYPQSLTVVPELVRPVHPWKDCLAWRKLTRLFRVRQPEVVHTHSSKAGILGRLAAARTGVPTIVHTIHGPSFGSFQGPLANSIFRALERYAARVTTQFVVVAQAMQEQYLAAGIGRPEQYTKILSGFTLEPFLSSTNDLQLRTRLGLASDDVVVGKIARLFELKGHDDLLTIAPELTRSCPRIKLLFVGDGPWRGRLESRARSLGLEKHVVFAGLVPPNAVPPLVGIMDLLVHLSLREGLPRALPQALAAARPVVAYDCDGAGEVCLEDETGYLLPPGDLRGLRDRLLRLAEDPALRQRLGRQGQQFVRERFAVQRMVDDLHQLYLRLAVRQA
ncbi:MAG TPA: glycosyltransferase family 4 protein [Candidatus Paceibacterota bacterium]|nr:glycosyltransferase family 4 protein [Verrucomicrobiota bacterium]HSA10199.1 glycosyltransferase family 4 protein [Candidatus Paceibacterota bacterium]